MNLKVKSNIIICCLVFVSLFLPCCGNNAECASDGDCDMFIGEYCDLSVHTCKCYWWENRSVTLMVNENCSSDMSFESCIAAIQSAMALWNDIECSDMLLTYGGTTTNTDVGYNIENPEVNINLIVWQESSWEYDPNTQLVSKIAYNTASGMAADADIVLNGEGFVFSASDLEDMLGIEFGKVIGVENTESICDKFPTGEPSSCADER